MEFFIEIIITLHDLANNNEDNVEILRIKSLVNQENLYHIININFLKHCISPYVVQVRSETRLLNQLLCEKL